MAITDGHPAILTRLEGREASQSQRSKAMAGQQRVRTGYSRDEYPFASTHQAGTGARIAEVPVAEQNSQGGTPSSFYRKYDITEGNRFRVIVKP